MLLSRARERTWPTHATSAATVLSVPLSCNAAFAMLQCSFRLLQRSFWYKWPLHCRKSECCSAASAVQLSEKCSATSVFAAGMSRGWGLEGWDLGLPDLGGAFPFIVQQNPESSWPKGAQRPTCAGGHLPSFL